MDWVVEVSCDPNCLDFCRLLSDVRQVELIASGHGVRARKFLQKLYGTGEWRKMKGMARVETFAGEIVKAEVHWYEAHGIGRKRFKMKRVMS